MPGVADLVWLLSGFLNARIRVILKAKFIGGDGMQTPNFIKLAGSAAEGAMASIPGLPKEQMPGGKEFLARYKAKFNVAARELRAQRRTHTDGD